MPIYKVRATVERVITTLVVAKDEEDAATRFADGHYLGQYDGSEYVEAEEVHNITIIGDISELEYKEFQYLTGSRGTHGKPC